MNLYYSRICRKLGLAKVTVWGIAYRKATNFDSILTDKRKDEPFKILPNTEEFWFADPLLFEHKGKIWLFVEAYNYSSNKGEIGVFDVIDGEPHNFRIIITTARHMSYPFVFNYNEEYYMIPETGAAKEIVLYKAYSFPDVWKREKVLLSGAVYRDTTVFPNQNGTFTLFTYRQIGTNGLLVKYYVEKFILDVRNFELTKVEEYLDKKKIHRPAGPFFSVKGETYRVAQKCSRAYGECIRLIRI